MNTLFTGQNRINLKSVDSTNNFAAKLAELPDWMNGTVIVAESQEAGRGQRAREWYSQGGQNLTCSFIFELPFLSLDKLYLWNQCIALATYRCLEKFGIPDLRIKWPNDMLQDGKKIAGILIENSTQGKSIHHSIVGIGINVNQREFHPINASSIALATNSIVEVEEVLQTLCVEIEKHYLLLRSGLTSELEDYYEFLFGFNEWRTFLWEGKPHRAKLKQLNQQWLGLFEFENGDEKWLNHAEISWQI